MRILSLPIVVSGLFVALPVFAQAQGGPTPPPSATDQKPAETPGAGEQEPAPNPPQKPAAAEAAGTAAATVTTPPTPTVVPMTGAKHETTPVSSPSQRGSDVAASDNTWKLEYHGYLRAPLRMGMGHRENPLPGQSSNTFHYPVIPDDQYLNWQFTSHNKKDWAEMFFSYGNSFAKGTLALQGFNFTDAAWTDTSSQFGISQGWVELTPDLGFENFRLSAKAGSFWSRYGLAGKWDAGEYDTYLFGRTHVMGEVIHIDYDIDDAHTLWFEHGFGVKRPDPSQFNNARFTLLNHLHAGIKLGSDIEFTAHYMAAWTQEEDRIVRRVNSPPAPMEPLPDTYNPPNYPSTLLGLPDGKMWIAGLDGRFELGAFGYAYLGYSHIGATNAISVAPAVEVLHAFGGGQYQLGLTDNYFGPSCRAPSGDTTNRTPSALYGADDVGCSMGTGKVDSVLAQYEFSLTNFRQISSGGQKFWGEGRDLKVVLYGMFNHVTSDAMMPAPGATGATKSTLPNGKKIFDGINKIKYGADVQVQIFPWLTFATRFDRVQPNSNIPEQSFSILSPRFVFKSKWATREQISIQYSRYMYNQRECEHGFSPAVAVSNPMGPVDNPAGSQDQYQYAPHLTDPKQLFCAQPPAAPASSEAFGSNYETQDAGLRGAPTTRPDVNVFKIEASMWW